ncbi:hypothetical protein EDD68_11523 [Melghiribacillus thermohalophilus]|uniref:Uncharacterized protein n=1 Tax=Melghiribacillus thermohalophilus TaxID=1324956 RepID=A0A4R3MYZ6_9BACI|nr:hypothetical protein [Melghiribacillus thermohalophilus]TCT19973.1 hypothetical protein EDD68_11523 [Melghiribacillus thermohalophilus]
MGKKRRVDHDREPYYADEQQTMVYLRSELDRYKNQLKQIQQRIRFRQFDSLLEENENLLLKIEKLQEQLERAKREAHHHKETDGYKKVMLNDSIYIARLNKKEEEKQKLKAKIQLLEKEREELNERIEQLEGRVRSFHNLEANLTKKILDLTEEKENMLRQTEEEKGACEEEVKTYRKANERLYAKIYELESELKQNRNGQEVLDHHEESSSESSSSSQ